MLQTCVWILGLVVSADPALDFREQVAPLLERRCVSCHHADAPKGGLALDSRPSAVKGGNSGPAIVSGQPDASLLFDYVSGESPEMPKNGPPLSTAELALLRKWIAEGAVWPEGVTLQERPAADANWWSLQPLVRPSVPVVGHDDGSASQNPIDCFIQSRLQQAGLTPSPEADRRTLIRRLSFDLLGLPPTTEAIDRFVGDPSPAAYERLVEELLASPHYGERWARHWLDVVHYGETHGYDKDKPRLHAWPYRDYVIRALNQDKPYAQFVREQIAGDVLGENPVDGITALGFIAAGPWDFIGHAEVPESKTDGKIARNLDRDDMVVNTLNTFCSLTVQCARCHAHKFDPISQTDYYRLQAVFAALDRADRPFDSQPEIQQRRAVLLAELRAAEARVQVAASRVFALAGPRLTEIDQRLSSLSGQNSALVRKPPEHGYHSAIAARDDVEKWVQVDLESSQEIARVVLRPCYDDYKQIGAGFGFPPRFRIDVSDDAEFREHVRCLADHTALDLPNPQLAPQSFEMGNVTARYVRVTATRLASRRGDFLFALSELEVLDSEGKNVAREKGVTAHDSIEAPIRWRKSNLVDGLYPEGPAQNVLVERAALEQERRELLERMVPADVQAEQGAASSALERLKSELGSLPPPQMVYAGTIHFGSGAFRGTGPDGGRPRPIHVLHRGDVNSPRERVEPGVPPLVPGWPGAFMLPTEHSEQDRRVALAEWVVAPQNPLTWRSIVNRVWQYHFGAGLVDSPNDFGRMGQQPSHPELLDWLAVEFRDGGQSLKALHRLIVTSAAYRQTSDHRVEAAAVDAGNALLWRANRRKLDAEALRDSLLFVSGKLNLQMGGPSFQDFVIQRPEHSPHYEYHLHDPHNPQTHRRSVYRFLVRSQPQPFMTTLDCADPSMSVDKRNESINALQALALLNNGITLVAAEAFAERLTAEVAEESRVAAAFERALGRSPSPEEVATLAAYHRAHGLANTCRTIFNLNEFAFVD